MSTVNHPRVATISRLAKVQEQLSAWKEEQLSLALIQSHGAIHRGHQALIKAALKKADRVVVCIYENPLRFGSQKAPAHLARSADKDAEAIAEAGGHLVFSPADFDLFPGGIEAGTRVEVAELSTILCGRLHPGYFSAVSTVWVKLIQALRPDVIVVGEKDYQEWIILRRVLVDLLSPVGLLAVPTLREHDGLALSNTNRLLALRERNVASRLYETLQHLRKRLEKGDRDYAAIQDTGMKMLERAGLVPEYVSVRQASDLAPARAQTAHFVVLAAATLGACRLTDGVLFRAEGASG